MISQGGTFVGTILLARVLPVSDFGLVAMAQVYLVLLQQFIDAGFLDGLIQRPSLGQKELAGAFWLLLVAGWAAFGCSLLARDLIEAAFATPGIGWIVVVQTSVLLFLPFRTVAHAVLAREVRIEELSKREALVNLLRLAASVWLARRGAGVWSLVFPQVASEMVFSLSAYRRAGWRLTPEFSWTAVRPLARYGLDITLSRAVWFAGSRADQFIVGRVLGPTSLGLYSLAQQFAEALPQFGGATLTRVAFPLFARLQGDTVRLRRAFLDVSRYTAYVAVPAFAGLVLVAPDLFAVVLEPSWIPAVAPMQVMCFVAFFRMMGALASFVINARGGTRRNLVLNVLVAIVTVLGVGLGAAIGRLTWVAILVASGTIPAALLFVRAAMRECGGTLGEWLKRLSGPVGATLLMSACVVGLGALLPSGRHLLRLLSMASVGAVVYGVAAFAVARELVAEFRGPRHPIGETGP